MRMTISKAIQARVGHNRPPETIPTDARIELRQRLENEYSAMVMRGADLEVAATQLPGEITPENEGRITDFLAKQISPFLATVKIAHDKEKENFKILGQVCDTFFTTNIWKRLREAIAPINARMTAYQTKQREIARAIQLEEKRIAEEALREAREKALRERLAAQQTAPLDRSEAREHMEAAKKAEAEAADAARIINAPPDSGHIRGDFGSTGYLRDNWKCEVEDITLVPFKYHSFNERQANADVAVAVRTARRAGKEPPGISIPGVRIYNDTKFVAKG